MYRCFIVLQCERTPQLRLYAPLLLRHHMGEMQLRLPLKRSKPPCVVQRQTGKIVLPYWFYYRWKVIIKRQIRGFKSDWDVVPSKREFRSECVFLCIYRCESWYATCLQFTSLMWRQHCEYFIDFRFSFGSLSWILCPFFPFFFFFLLKRYEAVFLLSRVTKICRTPL